MRLPIEKKVISEVRVEKDKIRVEEMPRKPNGLVTHHRRPGASSTTSSSRRWRSTTCRCPSKHLSRIIADCYQLLGRRETIELLDRMKEIGFRESTR